MVKPGYLPLKVTTTRLRSTCCCYCEGKIYESYTVPAVSNGLEEPLILRGRPDASKISMRRSWLKKPKRCHEGFPVEL